MTAIEGSASVRPGAPDIEQPAPEHPDDRLLRWVVTFFAVAVLLHNGDHLRRGGDSVSTDVFWIGSSAILLEVAIVVLVFHRHRLAPLGAAVTGFSLAAGYVLVHLLPERGWLSDPLFSGGASGVSQAAALLEIAAAITFGVAGLVVLRRRGGLTSATRPRPVRPLAAVVREPVVVAMAVGNALIFVFSL